MNAVKEIIGLFKAVAPAGIALVAILLVNGIAIALVVWVIVLVLRALGVLG